MKKDRKIVWVFPSSDITRCPVRLVDKYVSLCPQVVKTGKKAHFYLRCLEKLNPAQWYGEAPVGRNTLSKVVTKLLKNASLDGYFTNHSLRRTSATRLFLAGIDKKIVQEVTGHASDALNKYQVTSNAQKQQVSHILQNQMSPPSRPKKKEKPKSPVPSLEVNVTDKHSKGDYQFNCSCKRQKFNVNDGEELGNMISEIVSKRKSGTAKIKLEIEFCD